MEINVNNLEFTTITIRDGSGNMATYNLQDELRINDHDLHNEIRMQPSKYVYWCSILEQVRGYLESAELHEETVKANLYENAREDLMQNGTPKPTKDQIESWILRQDEYIEAREQENIYSNLVKRLTFIVKAFEQRHGMLVQMSALQRDQMEYERAIKQM